MRMACDVGGTFTDLLVEDDRHVRLFKASTTPDDPAAGVLAALELAAADRGECRQSLLARTSTFIHGTTRAINAILTGAVARTALLTTEGHRDILVIREGGRIEPFNFTVPYPEPYVPRALTFAVPERIDANGRVLTPLDEASVLGTIAELRGRRVEAVAVCLLWSIVNPSHEIRVGALLAEHLPAVPVTLSHRLNPTLREYRRASSACIDASLKPLMQSYLGGLARRLAEAGFRGRALMVTSQGGVMDAEAMAEAPIHAINSGPSMAPVAGRHFARVGDGSAIVADTGGTSYDVSLVRRGMIPWTRETWLGQPHRGHMTGFPSVDVKSIGAGGGSIAWVDGGGLLHVGPRSAGSMPGPACYGTGGTEPTVTDCAVVLGHIDPNYFLGGAMVLNAAAAAGALRAGVAARLGLELDEAAAAVMAVITEKMIGAIAEITVNQGIDPATAILVGGGGAAGLNSVAIAHRLGCRHLVIPEVGAALSAAGALMSDLTADYARMAFTTARNFDAARVDEVLEDLERRCRSFIAGPGEGSHEQTIEFVVEARYPHQIWEIEVPVKHARFAEPAALDELIDRFHAVHREIFAIEDRGSDVEFVTWRARVRCRLRDSDARIIGFARCGARERRTRRAYFSGLGWSNVAVERIESLPTNEPVHGPAIVESAFTTVVVEPGTVARRTDDGRLVVEVGPRVREGAR